MIDEYDTSNVPPNVSFEIVRFFNYLKWVDLELVQSFTNASEYLLLTTSKGDSALHVVLEGCKQKCQRSVIHFDSFLVIGSNVVDMSKALLSFVLRHAAKLTKVKNSLGQTPLSLACKLQLPAELIELLLQADTSIVNEPDTIGFTPLHHLVVGTVTQTYYQMRHVQKYPEVIAMMVDNGANVNAESNESKLTPLMCMLVYMNKMQNEVCLTKDGAEIAIFYSTIIQTLLEKGAATSSHLGEHVLRFVCMFEIAKTIVNFDTIEKINNITNVKNLQTPFHQFIENIVKPHIEDINIDVQKELANIFAYLLKKGAVIHSTEIDLIIMARDLKCEFSVIEYLLDNIYPDYDVNSKDKTGSTLLITYGTSVAAVHKLLELGADATLINSEGRNALFSACKHHQNIQAFRKLFELGCDPFVVNTEGFSVFEQRSFVDNVIRHEEWFKAYLSLISLPQLRNKSDILSSVFKTYLMAFACHYKPSNESEDYSEMTKNRPVVLAMVTNLLKVHKDNITFSPSQSQSGELTVGCFALNQPLLGPVGLLLIEVALAAVEFPLELIDELQAIRDAGLPLNSSNPHICASALTSLMIFEHSENTPEEVDDKAMELAVKLISEGDNVESVSLTITDVAILEILNPHTTMYERKDEMWLPDALFIAFLTHKQDRVDMMLNHWWAPPLALLLFNPALVNIEFIGWYIALKKYGGVPHGTEMFTRLSNLVTEMRDTAPEMFYPEAEEWCDKIFEEFTEMTSSPMSLRELSKYAVRHALAPKASEPGVSLPGLLQQVLSPTLHFLVVH